MSYIFSKLLCYKSVLEPLHLFEPRLDVYYIIFLVFCLSQSSLQIGDAPLFLKIPRSLRNSQKIPEDKLTAVTSLPM
jgi:hypothetical protein